MGDKSLDEITETHTEINTDENTILDLSNNNQI